MTTPTALTNFYNKHQRYFHFLFFFFIIALIRYFPVIFLHKTFFFGDNYSLQVPDRLFTMQWIKQGILPLWNPNTLSGLNWVGDISQNFFYPFNYFYLFFSPANALFIDVIVHIFIIMLGTYLLIYKLTKNHPGSLLGSMIFATGAAVTGNSNNIVCIQSLAWVPWVIWASYDLNKSWWQVIKTGWFVTILLLAAYPQYLFLALLPALAVSYIGAQPATKNSAQNLRKTKSKALTKSQIQIFGLLFKWLIVGVYAFCLGAITLLPFAANLAGSTRTIQSASQSASGSLKLPELVKMVIPHAFDAPVWGIKWGPVWSGFPTALPYITALGLLIVILNLKKLWRTQKATRYLMAALLISFVMALGKSIPHYTWIIDHIPFLTMIRYPSMWLITTHLLAVILLAYCFPLIKLSRRLVLSLSAFATLGLVVSLALLAASFYRPETLWQFINAITANRLALSHFHTLAKDILIFKMISMSTIMVCSTTMLGLFFIYRQKTWFFVGIAALEALLATQTIVMLAPSHIYPSSTNWQPEIAQVLKNSQYRVITRNNNKPYTDYGTYWEAYVIRRPFSDSFIDSNEIQNATFLNHMRDGLTPDWHEVAGVKNLLGYTTLMPRDYSQIWSSQKNEAWINYLPYIEIDNPLLKEWSVKYFIVDRWFEVKEDYGKLKKVYSRDNVDVYELPEALPRFRFEDNSPVDLANFIETPNQIKLTITNNQHQSLVIADRFDPGWQAKINGQKVSVENYNGMRRINLMPGQNQIEIYFWPIEFSWGIIISVVTITATLALIIYSRFTWKFPTDRLAWRSAPN